MPQQYQLSVMDLVVQTSADGSTTEVVPAQKLASWLHPGLVTALQVPLKVLTGWIAHVSLVLLQFGRQNPAMLSWFTSGDAWWGYSPRRGVKGVRRPGLDALMLRFGRWNWGQRYALQLTRQSELAQVVDFRGGEVVIYTGSADGVVCRLRLQVPTSPGADPAQVQARPSHHSPVPSSSTLP